jgi:hypothetical protein
VLVSVQFPIADARGFDADPRLRLSLPDWPDLATGIGRQYVNRFGPAVDRRRDPDLSYPDEAKFCLARRALRFQNCLRESQTSTDFVAVDCAFRRLLCDGTALTRTEIGFRAKRGWLPVLTTPDACLKLVTKICELPTFVGGESESRPMIRQGNALAELLARATTPSRENDLRQRASNLVEVGNPVLVVELDPEVAWQSGPPGFDRIASEKVRGCELYFGRVRTKSATVATWILRAGKDRALDRLLRLCLLRLHAEQEVLDIMIKQVVRGRIPRALADVEERSPTVADRLDEYFNKTTRLLNREQWHGINQSAVIEAFDAAESVVRVATRLGRIERYDGARLQVRRKLEDYAARRAAIRLVKHVNVLPGASYVDNQNIANVSGTGNIVNVAQYMSDITNTVNNNLAKSEVTDEVKELLQDLLKQIYQIGPKIEPKLLKRMAQDVSTLSAEAASDEPRRKWYEITLEGLKEAATAVGEIANPIVSTVAKLMPLLLGTL